MWRLGWASALCVVLLAGYAQAQTIPTKKAKRHSISARKPAPPASDQERPPATPKSKAGGGCGHAEHQPRKGPVVPDSGAQWSCAQPIVTAEPVWVGSRVEFVFKIKNEGTSELRIKAKGG